MLVIPKIMADAINEKLGVALKMGQLATDVTNEVADITQCADEIHFPKYERVASVGTVTKGTPLVPAQVSMTDSVAKIKQTGGSIRVYDVDEKQIKGSTLDNMAQQLVDAISKSIDTDLSNTMDAEAIKKSPCGSATEITHKELLDAMMLYGDDCEAGSFSIAINSRLLPSFLMMPEFTSVEKTYQHQGNGLIKNNLVGYWMGAEVILTNNGTYKDNECVTYMVKSGSLGFCKQKETTLEIEREGKLLANDIIVSNLYATKVMDTDGIVIIRKTIS